VAEHHFRIAQLMKGVGNKHSINGARRKARIVFIAQDHADVPLLAEQCSNPQERQRKLANINRQYLAFCSDDGRKLQCKIASSRTQVDDYIPRSQIQGLKNFSGALPLIALRLDYVQLPERTDCGVQHIHHREDDDGAQQEQYKPAPMSPQNSRVRHLSGHWLSVRDNDNLHIFGQANNSLYGIARQGGKGGPSSGSCDKDLSDLITACEINHGRSNVVGFQDSSFDV
jgi:hypothetical protein